MQDKNLAVLAYQFQLSEIAFESQIASEWIGADVD